MNDNQGQDPAHLAIFNVGRLEHPPLIKYLQEREIPYLTEVELIYRNKIKASERAKISTSKDAYDLLMKAWDENKIELVEQFKVILLDRSNSVLGISNVSTGSITACIVDPKIVFATALKARATGIILAHNHPSGNVKQSTEDQKLTNEFAKAGKILEIPVLDHLVVTKDGYTSFADEGLML